MVKGGYKIIDFKNTAFTSGQEGTIAGIYDAISNPYNKATMVSGLIVGDTAYPDFFAPFIAGKGSYTTAEVVGGNTVTITIDEDDNVTVTVVAG